MKIKQKISYFLLITLSSLAALSAAQGAASTSLSLNNTAGDAVQVVVTGAASSNIELSFLPPGAFTVSKVGFGTTDASGNFSTTISSGGYGIPKGSPVFTTVNGQQSVTMLWPNYTASLTLSQSSVQVAVGQSLTINGTSALILAANSLPSSIAPAVSGSSVTVTGLSSGSGSLVLCGTNAGCVSIAVTVGSQSGQTQITFSSGNVVLNGKETKNVYIFGGSRNGYIIKSNSNPAAVEPIITGSSGTLVLYGKETSGTAAISVCSVEDISNCATLNVTVLNNAVATLSFSQNNLNLIPGLTQSITVSGASDNSYYIYSNSNSAVVQATAAGNLVTVTGGGTAGSAVITVCSNTVSGSCGSLNVTTNISSATPSATVLAFSQNAVAVNKEESSKVTVSGGVGANYVIASNSNPTAVTASISGSNIINLYGKEVGSSIVGVCSSASNTVCANLSVTVNPALVPIYFSQDNISLSSNQSLTVSISGGNDTNKVISSNSNPSVASGSISSGGSLITLTGGAVSGTTAIKICSASTAYSNNCASLSVTNTAVAPVPTIAEVLAIVKSTPIRNPNYTFSSDKAGTIVYGGDCSSSTASATVGNNTIAFSTLAPGLHSNCTIKVVDSSGNSSNLINVSPFTVTGATIVAESAPTSAASTPAAPKPTSSTAKVLGVGNYKFTRLLTLGAIGQEVSELQKILKKLGYFTYSTITGYFGSVTEKAVVAFQKAKNLKPYPGWTGPATRQALNSL